MWIRRTAAAADVKYGGRKYGGSTAAAAEVRRAEVKYGGCGSKVRRAEVKYGGRKLKTYVRYKKKEDFIDRQIMVSRKSRFCSKTLFS